MGATCVYLKISNEKEGQVNDWCGCHFIFNKVSGASALLFVSEVFKDGSAFNARLAKSFPCHAFWPLSLAFIEIKGQTITMAIMQMIGENIV